MLFERLKQATQREHLALEAVVGLASDRAGHRRQLQRFLGFVEPWEESVRRAPHGDLLAGRERAPALRADLLELGLTADRLDALPRCTALPPLHSAAQVLGSLYVMEGSTLGGQLVAHHLERTLGLRDGRGYSYFRGHGAATAERWRAFRTELAGRAAGEPVDDLVAAATATFAALAQWFRQELPPP